MKPWDMRPGNCLEGMATLGDRSVDHVIMDPPYESEAHTLQRRVKRETQPGGDRVMHVEPLSFQPITDEQRLCAARETARVARRWILVFCQIEAAMKWRGALEEAGAVYRRTCIWVKPDGMPQLSGDRPGMGYESIVVCHAPGRSRWNAGGKLGVYIVNKGGDPRSGHPTQKPVALMEDLIRDFSDPGETILDPFAGSGTTGVAALRLGRRFIGFEKDPAYFDTAVKRLAGERVLPSAYFDARQGSLL